MKKKRRQDESGKVYQDTKAVFGHDKAELDYEVRKAKLEGYTQLVGRRRTVNHDLFYQKMGRPFAPPTAPRA